MKYGIWFSHGRQHSSAGLFLLVTILFTGISLFGQTRLTGFLNVDGATYRINQDGANYIDYIIPQPGANPYLTITARGGDGGRVYARSSILDNMFIAKAHGGQGATAVATFKIGSGANELNPGGTLRVIIGRAGDSDYLYYYGFHNSGAGGGGGTGVVYLPGGADGNTPSNWKILLVAGAGGGAHMMGTGGTPGNKPIPKDGLPGQTSENGDHLFLTQTCQICPPFGSSGNGGATSTRGSRGGGGTSYLTYQQAANGQPWGQGYNGGNNGSTLMGDGSTEIYNSGIGSVADGALLYGGRGLFQWVGGKLLPVGGMGGSGDHWGGYGCGSGGGGDRGSDDRWTYKIKGTGGAGGGYSGGQGGGEWLDWDASGSGGGSYINPAFVTLNTGYKIRNGVAVEPINGFIEYKFSGNYQAVSRDLGFEYHVPTEVSVLKTGAWNLLWQYDGNLVLYGPGYGNGAWTSHTDNKGTDLYFQGDGNMVIYQSGNPVFASNTANDQHGGKGGRKLVLTSEGGLYITDQDGRVIWQGH
ncbi:MAG: hypothetical protein R3D58_09345 [Saprospiraceae bacterium]